MQKALPLRALVVLYFILTAPSLFAQEFAFTFHVSDADKNQDLTIGLNLNATDGIDAGDTAAPPPAPSGFFIAFIVGTPSTPGINFTTDIRRYRSNPTSFEIQYDKGFSQTEITITWDPNDLPAGRSFTLTDAFGGTFFSQDMLSTNSLVTSASVNPILQNGLVIALGQGQNLPVELTSFEVEQAGDVMQLYWTTLTETQNAGFFVERASIGIADPSWESLVFIEGQGTTTFPQHYAYADFTAPLDEGRLFYRLKQVDFDGTFAYSPVVEVAIVHPRTFTLYPAYPNPFNLTTQIRYTLNARTPVELKVYDATGRLVHILVHEMQGAGWHEVTFDAANQGAGLYFYQLIAGNFVDTQAIFLAK